MLKKKILIFFIYITLLYLLPRYAYAENLYKADYKFTYTYLGNNNTLVKALIEIQNKRSDIFIKEFSLSFPANQNITNLKANSTSGKLQIKKHKIENSLVYTFVFETPIIGTLNKNTLELLYNQDGIFFEEGNVLECFIPLFSQKDYSSLIINIELPENNNKKVSMSQPIPTKITKNKILFENPNSPYIYIIIGEFQLYDLNLKYNLENPYMTKIRTEIAFPPETLYQHLIVTSIDPKPINTFIDDDGNFMAYYDLEPKQKIIVNFKGIIKVFIKEQSDMKAYIEKSFQKQKFYLLSKPNVWNIDKLSNNKEIEKLYTPEEIYNYILKKFNYSYKRINKIINRLGAEKALLNNNKTVCMEYTDTFIAIARLKGIYAREIQGAVYSPLHKNQFANLPYDVLHSWPEYFDTKLKIWKPIDPTWGDTSKIDYFNFFDINHIAFAIHGKDANYPKPAGSYKTKETIDLEIKTTTIQPKELSHLAIDQNITTNIFTNKRYHGTITITNTGNIFIKNQSLVLQSDSIYFTPNKKHFLLIPPFQKISIPISYYTDKTGIATYTISIGNKNKMRNVFFVKPFTSYIISQTIGVIAGTVFLILTIILFINFKKKKFI